MPKPTTHTDIVIVTKEDSPGGPRGMESVQLTLVSAGSLDSESLVIGHKKPIEARFGADLLGLPVGLVLTVGGKVLKLAYQPSVLHRGSYGKITSEPWPRPEGGQVGEAVSESFVWKNNADRAIVEEFKLSVYATLGATKLTVTQQASSENGTQRLLLKFMNGAEEMGELTMTAVMEALLVV